MNCMLYSCIESSRDRKSRLMQVLVHIILGDDHDLVEGSIGVG